MPTKKKVAANRLDVEPQVIGVRFRTNWKIYHYLCDFIVAVNDTVIVDSPTDGYTAVKVVEVGVTTNGASKRVVDVVDDTDYKAGIKLAADRASIVSRLETISKQANDMARFAAIAKGNPEAKKLLSQLKKLAA